MDEFLLFIGFSFSMLLSLFLVSHHELKNAKVIRLDDIKGDKLK